MSMQTCLTRLGMVATMATSSRHVHRMSAKVFSAVAGATAGTSIDANKISAAYSWCRTASIEPSSGLVSLESIAGHDHSDKNNQPIRTVSGRSFDLTQSTEWMEYIERKENRMNDEGGAGAYDTLRCDVIVSPAKRASCADTNLRVWGEDFHLKRLQKSYMFLVQESNENQKNTLDESNISLEEALQKSRSILHALLEEAQASARKMDGWNETDEISTYDNTLIQLFRATLLWSPPSEACSSVNGKILVRGHVSCSCKPIKVYLKPTSIVASVAVHLGHGDKGTTTIDSNLPTRHANPQNKIASWCRLRKKMENPETYKPRGVSEVLMVRRRQDQAGETRLEVLEGLSSNFFVAYDDGSLRTATEGVLNGYVRHLVLLAASKCGLNVAPRPIYLHETRLWKEAFITSSSRLIYPISSIITPEENGFREIWRDSVLQKDGKEPCPESEQAIQKWQQLQDEILKMGGYNAGEMQQLKS